jgi:DNA-binding response OmpR family regulator
MCLGSEGDMHGPNLRILYVEDDADTRDLVSYVLVGANYEVALAENPEQATLLAQTASFDLYLIDNWMPGMSGIDLCSRLREFDADTPILFYSGAAYEEDKRNAFAAGAQGYLTKPVDNEKFLKAVSSLISDARKARQRRI